MSNRGSAPVSDGSERFCGHLANSGIIGDDPGLVRALVLAERFARTDLPVLIQGETGTGKELFARAIHYASDRRTHPFEVFVPCMAPDGLLSNELFGHRAGAFTHADKDRPGIVDLADGGTLFLDEVQSLSLPDQVRLLRLLDTHEYRPLGGGLMRRADIRIVCACNVDLRGAVDAKEFRSDLYFRMARARLEIPPLRERRCDILVLAEHFLQKSRGRAGHRKVFLKCAEQALLSYLWPGNVRELDSVVHSAVVKADGDEISIANLDLWGCSDEWQLLSLDKASEENARCFVERYLRGLLAMYKGDIASVATIAGRDRSSVYRLLRDHNIDAEVYRTCRQAGDWTENTPHPPSMHLAQIPSVSS